MKVLKDWEKRKDIQEAEFKALLKEIELIKSGKIDAINQNIRIQTKPIQKIVDTKPKTIQRTNQASAYKNSYLEKLSISNKPHKHILRLEEEIEKYRQLFVNQTPSSSSSWIEKKPDGLLLNAARNQHLRKSADLQKDKISTSNSYGQLNVNQSQMVNSAALYTRSSSSQSQYSKTNSSQQTQTQKSIQKSNQRSITPTIGKSMNSNYGQQIHGSAANRVRLSPLPLLFGSQQSSQSKRKPSPVIREPTIMTNDQTKTNLSFNRTQETKFASDVKQAENSDLPRYSKDEEDDEQQNTDHDSKSRTQTSSVQFDLYEYDQQQQQQLQFIYNIDGTRLGSPSRLSSIAPLGTDSQRIITPLIYTSIEMVRRSNELNQLVQMRKATMDSETRNYLELKIQRLNESVEQAQQRKDEQLRTQTTMRAKMQQLRWRILIISISRILSVCDGLQEDRARRNLRDMWNTAIRGRKELLKQQKAVQRRQKMTRSWAILTRAIGRYITAFRSKKRSSNAVFLGQFLTEVKELTDMVIVIKAFKFQITICQGVMRSYYACRSARFELGMIIWRDEEDAIFKGTARKVVDPKLYPKKKSGQSAAAVLVAKQANSQQNKGISEEMNEMSLGLAALGVGSIQGIKVHGVTNLFTGDASKSGQSNAGMNKGSQGRRKAKKEKDIIPEEKRRSAVSEWISAHRKEYINSLDEVAVGEQEPFMFARDLRKDINQLVISTYEAVSGKQFNQNADGQITAGDVNKEIEKK
ncbi:MAG: hypothetical protein EZS28_015862 [Streblomastix strix]|uniref:Uncharacterized protein n=1 Tax=Streblomastix strix TaxID=222440 RepID=A0A5J4W2C3_9EUKA|nr:MAG: hypothetical protein EZS28_015862 [Streblomastix strix]